MYGTSNVVQNYVGDCMPLNERCLVKAAQHNIAIKHRNPKLTPSNCISRSNNGDIHACTYLGWSINGYKKN